MYTRILEPPRGSFFLLGPRGTGKSTWVRRNFRDALTINLLPSEMMLRYQRDPSLFRAEVLAQPRDRWIVVDEIQRVPNLLDEVHYLMEEKGHKRFVLTGSSARKLKKGAANLLAGRAVVRNLFPLTTSELGGAASLSQLIRYGSMPLSVNADDEEMREDFLRAYVTTYLAEEIKAEALVRDLGPFSRFLGVTSLAAGQRTNIAGLARDAAISRDTARGYFEVLIDTLIGHWLPAYRPRAKVKEQALPKFYWFDPGVLQAAAGAFDQPPPVDWDGILLEHLLLHEMRSYLHYSRARGTLGYWATPSGSEVDFVWWYGRKIVLIEAKHATEYRREHRKGIESFLQNKAATSYIVYRGERELDVEGTHVLPVEAFLRKLHSGQILG